MKKIVIKLGTSTLTKGTKSLSRPQMLEMARQIALLHNLGKDVVIVTSGAVAAGRELLKHPKIDRSLPVKQMLSAVGQVHLMHLWTELFAIFNISVGQVLLTRTDFSQRLRYLNVRDTLFSLLQHRVIPIINENDTVAIPESKVGDNDNLSALVSNMIAADMLILLTDQEGLYTKDPRLDPQAELITRVDQIDEKILSLAGESSTKVGLGTGGMITKIEAARLASQSGTPTVIASSTAENILVSLAMGKSSGTYFSALTTPLESRKRWLLSEKPQGNVTVDLGAEERLSQKGASLLPIGIKKTSERFDRGSIIRIISQKGVAFGAGISNYSSHEIQKLLGIHSGKIEDALGYTYGPEVIHRDNLIILKK